MNRCHEDDEFVGWLYSMNYAVEEKGGPKPYMTLGVILYMYEAWLASRAHEKVAGP